MTSQRPLHLPRRLPKQPNEVFHAEAPEPIVAIPFQTDRPAPEDHVPQFEMGPDLPDTIWPEFDPQEFTYPEEEEITPTQAFTAPGERRMPFQKVSAYDDYRASTHDFIAENEYLPPAEEFVLPEPPARPSRYSAAPPLPPPPVPAPAPPVPPPAPPRQTTEKQSGQQPVVQESKLSSGDPKPAFARPSGPSRSRPSRPSGAIAAARLSGSFPVAEPSRSTFVGDETRRSGEFAAANIAPADIAPRLSGQTDVAKVEQEASPSRVTNVARRQRPSRSTVPALILLSVMLVGYSFAVGPIESYLESQLIHSSGPTGTLMTLVPWVSLLPVLLLLGSVLWIIAGLIGLRHVKQRARKSRAGDTVAGRKRKKERRKAPLELFRDEAATEDIDATTAYQTWRVLQPFGPDNHVLSIHDEFENALGMRPHDVQSVFQQLAPAEFHAGSFRLRTVLDLLRVLKQASLSRR